ncbi:BA14K family protein [Bradyrhizobium sp. Gha]|uniref:BA14K family protein n=1 Tax=Bradyrhizobium sp. Gha TaxID=1855318 RepID=UPI0008E0BCFC|nr:BA14K family protein [Bradyrhizobium sp. Gha]SFI54908.1 BA14K-like protein [Bradyrhizobium sp. Gha]
MNSLRVLGAAAALALVIPMATPSFAQGRGGHGGFGGGHFSGGGAHFSGGGAHFGGGSSFTANAAAMRPSGGAAPTFGGARTFSSASPTFSGGTRSFSTASTGNWGGRNWNGGWHHHRGGGFWPGFAAGAAIGGLGSYAYYGGPYYDDSYYDDGYYDDGAAVAVVPDGGGDAAAYCAQRYRSYDPASGTYLGYDGLRHPCP